MTDKYIAKNSLLRLLRMCMSAKELNAEDEEEFNNELTETVKQIWAALAANRHQDTDMWLSSCRVGVFGLYTLNKDIHEIYQFFDSSFEEDSSISVPAINLNFRIENPYAFKLSLIYGYINLIIYLKCSDVQRLRSLYDKIFAGCLIQARHNNIYFQLLLKFLENFPHVLTKIRISQVFELITYNFDKKECCALIKCVFTHPKFRNTEAVFRELLGTVSWKFKFKYILLTEIINLHPSFIHKIDPDDFAQAIMFSQTSPYLCAAAGKLYATIDRLSTYKFWQDHFLSHIKFVLTNAGTPTLEQKNLFKYCLSHSLKQYPDLLTDLLAELNSCAQIPHYSILSLVVFGVRQSLFERSHNMAPYITMGLDHNDANVRNMSFELLCSSNVTTSEAFYRVYHFILLNINSADQASRDSIRRSFECVLRQIQMFVVAAKPEDEERVNELRNTFNLMIAFLMSNFSFNSNYQRLTTSIMLIEIFVSYFPRRAAPRLGEEAQQKLLDFSLGLNVYKSHERFYFEVLFMLVGSKIEQKDRILNTIFNQIISVTEDKLPITDLMGMGMEKIVSHNFEVADEGVKLILFNMRKLVMEKKYDEIDDQLATIFNMMLDQWNNIKRNKSDTVVFQKNPLHTFITLTDALLHLFDPEGFDDLFKFIEEIVENLLNVFELRCIIPFRGRYCTGIAIAFHDQKSTCHKSTINCMWLALRACCRLSVHITMRANIEGFMNRTLNILFEVIHRCFHKGTLEEAGSTLSQLVNYSTTNNLFVSALEAYVDMIIERVPDMTTLTSTVRRSAEIRTFLCAIAISDKRFNKPLFHKIMVFLKDQLHYHVNIPKTEQTPSTSALYCLILHCLQPIILDNSVENHITEYLADLLIDCMESFEQYDWKVRNAALQTVGALSNRLLGPNVAPNVKEEWRSVCLEEFFYKNSKLFDYIIQKFRTLQVGDVSRMTTVTPMISLIGLSYTRGGICSVQTRMQMANLENRVMKFVFHSLCNYQFNSASKAYAAVCSHTNVERAMKLFISNMTEKTYRRDKFFSSVYVIEVLYRQLIDDMAIIPNSETIAESCTARLNVLLDFIAGAENFGYVVVSRIILFKHGLQKVTIEDVEHNLTYICQNREIAKEIPGIWSWISASIRRVIIHNNIEDIKQLIQISFIENTPVIFKKMIINVMKIRASKSEAVRDFIGRELCDVFINFIFNENVYPIKFVVEDCIAMISDMETITVSAELVTRCMETMCNFENGLLPVYFMPIYCAIIQQYGRQLNGVEAKKLFEICFKKCATALKDEDYENLIIFKSCIFIARYIQQTQDRPFLLLLLKLCFNMLQHGIPELDQEVYKVISFFFKIKNQHAFATILHVININHLMPLLGKFHTAQLLIRIYTDRHSPVDTSSSLEQNKILAINTHVIINQINDNINGVIALMSPEEQVSIKEWYKEFSIDEIHSCHSIKMHNFLSQLNYDVLY